MAHLTQDDDDTREAWLMYALEFARRGLWPEREIVTHGPHGPDADYIWGEAGCRDVRGWGVEAHFETSHGKTGIQDLRGLKIFACDGNDVVRFPVRPVSALPAEWREAVTAAKNELERLRAARRY